MNTQNRRDWLSFWRACILLLLGMALGFVITGCGAGESQLRASTELSSDTPQQQPVQRDVRTDVKPAEPEVQATNARPSSARVERPDVREFDHPDGSLGGGELQASDLRALAHRQRKIARYHDWLANHGRGSGGMFDVSGHSLRTAAGMTKAELVRLAGEARDQAAKFERLARRIEARSERMSRIPSGQGSARNPEL
ncbi:MAG: hypothetical protein MJE77_11800 [Proteobacteria bacterium]|nr:hypothetical protein [Pseudomonadota bacterium]